MNKKYILKSKQLFNDIIRNNNFYKNEFFIIYYKEKKEEQPLFGIAISKKYGQAVERNKIKRQLRSIINENKFLFSKHYDYIIMVKRNCKNKKYFDLKEKLELLIKEKVNK